MKKTVRLRGAIFLLWAGMGSLTMAQQAVPPELVVYPDLILHTGKVLTADDSFTIAQAVAIREGKFLAVGESARILQMKGSNTQVLDLQGKTATPGFIDTHFHLHNYTFNRYVNGGIDIYPVVLISDLEGNETKESLLRALRRKARQTPPRDGWIVLTDARGEDHGVIEGTLIPSLTTKDVDETFPAAVAAAVGASHGNNYSVYVVNGPGMKIVMEKIPAGTPGIVMDPKTGQPTGKLEGDAAEWFGRGVLPWPDEKLVMQALEKGIPQYTAQGLTMIQTKTPGYVMEVLREFWRRGQMPIRWRAQLDVGPDVEVSFKYLGNLTDLGDPLLRITSGPGGVPSPFWDATYQQPNPLPGRPPRRGEGPNYEARQAQLKGPTPAFLAAKYGWSMTNVHNEGDMSTDAYMAEIEKGLKERVIEAYGQRFNTDHSLMLTRETVRGNQFERMKKLGIIPSMKIPTLFRALDAGDDPNHIPEMSPIERLSKAWGKERVARMEPVHSLIEAGFKPTSESDSWYYPASSPLYSLEKLVTRKDDKFGMVWGPQERVSRQQALWMRTNWAAYYTGDEKELGTIEPGKWADLVVLDKDYMSVPEDDISEIQIRMTVIGGRVVYDASRDRVSMPIIPGTAQNR